MLIENENRNLWFLVLYEITWQFKAKETILQFRHLKWQLGGMTSYWIWFEEYIDIDWYALNYNKDQEYMSYWWFVQMAVILESKEALVYRIEEYRNHSWLVQMRVTWESKEALMKNIDVHWMLIEKENRNLWFLVLTEITWQLKEALEGNAIHSIDFKGINEVENSSFQLNWI